jgi:SAM-dependent methyltransferase
MTRQPLKPEATYRPIASVWHGTDAALLEEMLDFYPTKSPGIILDATVNAGRFWKGSSRKIIGLDINPSFRPTVVGDNRDMPFNDDCFDVVVYDPPHVPNQGKDRSKDFNTRFGLVIKSPKGSCNLNHLYQPFAMEAYRVLKPQGILFCKITDYIHDHRYQWAHVEFMQTAVSVGFCACDCIVKVRKGPIVDPKWKKAHHARRHHCYWLLACLSQIASLRKITSKNLFDDTSFFVILP